MLKKIPIHYGDGTCFSCVVAGDFIYIKTSCRQIRQTYQVKAALESIKRILSAADPISFIIARGERFDIQASGFSVVQRIDYPFAAS